MDRKPLTVVKPRRSAIIRAVASSTAIDTARLVGQLEAALHKAHSAAPNIRLRGLKLAN